MLKMWLVFYLGNWLPLAGMLVWWRSMWTFLFLGSTVRLKAMVQGPVNQHWGSCKGRGWGTECHGFLMVEGQLEKKECPCCTVPPECPLCNRTLTVLNSLVACKISWMSRWVPMHYIFWFELRLRELRKGSLAWDMLLLCVLHNFFLLWLGHLEQHRSFWTADINFKNPWMILFPMSMVVISTGIASWELFESYLRVLGAFFESCFRCSSELPVFWELLESYVWKVYLRYWMQLGQYGIDLLGLL